MTPLVSSLFLAGALRGSLELSDRTEARVTGTTNPTTYSAEVMTNPSGLVRFGTRRFEIAAGYAPSLTLRGLGIDPVFDALHRGSLDLSITANRRLVLTASGDVSYGTFRFLSAALPEADFASVDSIDTLPDADTVTYGSIGASIGARYIASRRLRLDALAEYQRSGGVGDASIAIYPQTAGPRAHIAAEFAFTRKDSARSTAEATWVTFSTGEESMLVQLSEAWLHRITRATTSTFGLGAALDSSRRSAGAASRTIIYPVAEAAVAHEVPEKQVELGLALRVEPVIDRLRGEVDPRLLLDASATVQATRRLSIYGRTGAAQSLQVSEPEALTMAYGEAGAGIRIADWFELVNGTRAAYQFRSETEPHRLHWMIFSGATFTAPRIRF
ncbi:MAG: hypothetical protein HUU21_10340 [Polyangiaceae bacterium]|nr:hypothetical protein [Polyangiaceae bacterium]